MAGAVAPSHEALWQNADQQLEVATWLRMYYIQPLLPSPRFPSLASPFILTLNSLSLPGSQRIPLKLGKPSFALC